MASDYLKEIAGYNGPHPDCPNNIEAAAEHFQVAVLAAKAGEEYIDRAPWEGKVNARAAIRENLEQAISLLQDMIPKEEWE